MSKDWEKELEEIMLEYGYDDAVKPVKDWLAKQRTQLLKEVKEKVIKIPLRTGDGTENDEIIEDGIQEAFLRQEQLKKLKELEEGKE